MGPLYDVGVRAECALGSRKRFARHRARGPPSSHDGGRDDGIRGHAGVAAGDDVDRWSLHRRRVGDRFRSVRSPRDVARRARQERRQLAQARGGIPQPRRQRLERRGPAGRRSSLSITCLQAENSKRDRAGTESVSRLLASSFGRAQGAACVRIASPRRGSALASTLLLQEARVGSHLPRPPPHHSTTTVMGFHPDPNSGENACFRFACLRYSRPWRGSR